jgi:hypothetical protein
LLPEFEPTWELYWSRLNKHFPAQPLLPQPNLAPFYRVAGLCLFQLGTDKKRNKPYLTMAAKEPYYNFHALKALADECIASFHEGKENVIKDPLAAIKKAQYYAVQAAKCHHAPGYLLLADVNFWSAQFLQSYNEDITIAMGLYEIGYTHLIIAQTLLPHCEAAIHNAYFGQGIKASNQWGLDSVESLMVNLQSFCRQGAVLIVTERAKETARRESQAIIDQHYSASISPMETEEDDELVAFDLN